MITPNLASRPFLNNRPVWLVTALAAFIAVVLIAINLRLFLVDNKALANETRTRDQLSREKEEIVRRVRADVAALERVPWRSLRGRVEASNLILREHAFSWLQMLDDIERIMPYDLRLTRITPSVGQDGISLSFDAVAKNREAMLQLLDNLIADPRFEEPSPTAEGTPEESGTGFYTLSTRVRYLPPGEGQ
jgi:hypothetical protein